MIRCSRLHCDAHTVVDESVYVMGHAESAAHVAGIRGRSRRSGRDSITNNPTTGTYFRTPTTDRPKRRSFESSRLSTESSGTLF
jgi:hypothetical protein